MRNLILILVLSLTALVSTTATGMNLDHAGGVMPGAMASMSMDGHDCPSCPNDTMGDTADNTACGECAACVAVGREVLQPTAQPVAMKFSRVGTLRTAPLPASRVEADDPPPPRA